ncbi:MAG: UDP-N-acetylmuramoyl-L-alanine--D-glutamate ligase, partial [Pseudomonadota bacterium]|nr:UDP-N-acetylmuramoyl-L-alanine--D-glutamate ligase [Pseudomonadota bacterium]
IIDPKTFDMSGIDTLVLSPGIPHTWPEPHPIVAKAKASGIEIVCDVELFARAMPKARLIGITGTNGKSTTTSLLHHILTGSGIKSQAGGNLGLPVLDFDPKPDDCVYILEMSSYQIELVRSVCFERALLLNIAPDHLDRHGGMAGYVASKMRMLTELAALDGETVIALDDAYCAQIADRLTAGGRSVLPISTSRQLKHGVHVTMGRLMDAIGARAQHVIDLTSIDSLKGAHNWQNAAAAYALARRLGLKPDIIARQLASYPGLDHRQKPIRHIGNTVYIDDSKATNAEAAAVALNSFENIYWIAGGRPKEGGFGALDPYLDKVRYAFLIGEAADDMADWIGTRTRSKVCGDLATALIEAHGAARTDSDKAVVLLSPACSSFDQFRNFEDRGRAFERLVRELPKAEKTS